jgi:hypothetical protein
MIIDEHDPDLGSFNERLHESRPRLR